MANLKKRILSSNFIWRLTGLTYRTAIIATHGTYVNVQKYIIEGKHGMLLLAKYFDSSKNVLEFGCGPGKNLFGISDKIKAGYGIDINSGYIRIANKIKNKYHIENLIFMKYNGTNFPNIGKIDIILEKSVFERIPKEKVSFYIGNLKNSYLFSDGIMILFFLMERARNTIFTQRLGNEAYVFWSDSEIRDLLRKQNLSIIEIISWNDGDFYIVKRLD